MNRWAKVGILLAGAALLYFVLAPTQPGGPTGWVDDPKAVKEVLQGLPRPVFGAEAPGLVAEADDRKDALLYLAVKKVNGEKHPRAHNQNPVGSCVSHGYSTGVEYLQCIDIVLKNRPLTYKPISHSFIYGTSRVDIGGGRLRGGDGSVGAWAAKAINTIGVVSCEDAGDDNYSSKFTRQWGDRGVPAPLKEIASKTMVKTVSLVGSAQEAMAAIQNGYPVPVCFRTGFSMSRDSDGFCRAQGTWGHCQLCCAYRGDKKAFLLLQSWGDNVPSGPLAKDQPDYSFWITWDVMERICREQDSFAISNFDGFPGRSREIDWFVHSGRRDDTLVAAIRLPLLARFLTKGGYDYAFSDN